MKIVKTIAAFNQIIIMDSNGNSDPLTIVAIFIALNIVFTSGLTVRYFYIKHRIGYRYGDFNWYQKIFLDEDTGNMNIFTFLLICTNSLFLFFGLVLLIYNLLV